VHRNYASWKCPDFSHFPGDAKPLIFASPVTGRTEQDIHPGAGKYPTKSAIYQINKPQAHFISTFR
jgi:hypothetical protein